jgi:hypothetical protein
MTERPRWAVSALAIGIGIIYLIASTIGGSFTSGLIMLGVMVAYAVFLLIGGKSDVVQMLRGQPADERYKHIETRATVVAANVVAVFVVALAVIEFAKGRDGSPYTLIAFVFAVTYVLSLIGLRWRE